MNFNDINISTLILAKYTEKKSYRRDYSDQPRPFHSIAVMLDGTGELLYGNSVVRLSPGDVFYIPQGSTYRSNWETCADASQIVYYSMHFSFEKPPKNFYNNTYHIQKFSVDDLFALIKKYERLRQILLSPAENNFFAASLLFDILATVVPKMNMCANAGQHRSIEPALNYIRANLSGSVSVKRLAAMCFLSESRFFTLFKRQIAISPIQYKNSLLLEKAAQYVLIYPDKSVEEIADELNFSSSVYFIRQFRKHIGMTPYQYRQKQLSPKL